MSHLSQDIVLHLADILCSAVENESQSLEEDSPSDVTPPGCSIKEESSQSQELDNLLQTLEWLLQLSGNDANSCCERLRNCMVVVRGTQIMLNQSTEEVVENEATNTAPETVILSEHQSSEKCSGNQKDSAKNINVCERNVCSTSSEPAQKTPESNTGALLECKALQNNNKPGTVTFNDHTRPET